MIENLPSRTAQRVAMHRAAHQLLDEPCILNDPIALRVIGPEAKAGLEANPAAEESSPQSTYLRAFMAVRSRYAEDELDQAVRQGVRQYIILGAGLDTFAYRNPYPDGKLRVFEVDHPATQGWKRSRLAEAGIPIPENLTFVPVDFETQTLEESLKASGVDPQLSAFFSWLGVTPYLTEEALTATLRFIASMPAGSTVVFDYSISPSLMNPLQRRVFDALAARVAMAGEPWRLFFDPQQLASRLRGLGFSRIEDLDSGEMNARYFAGRKDGLQAGSLGHLMNARV